MKGLLITVVLGVAAYVGFKKYQNKVNEMPNIEYYILGQDISV